MKNYMRIRSYSGFIGKGLLADEQCGCTEYINVSVLQQIFAQTFIIQTVDLASQVL